MILPIMILVVFYKRVLSLKLLYLVDSLVDLLKRLFTKISYNGKIIPDLRGKLINDKLSLHDQSKI